MKRDEKKESGWERKKGRGGGERRGNEVEEKSENC